MDGYLALSPDRRRELCRSVGGRIGLDAPSVEKDYWVCWTLRELFALPEVGATLTFKGGTSLSKCWKLIERFSEDVDVVVDREALGFSGAGAPDYKGIGGKERTRRLAALKEACGDFVRGKLRAAFEERVDVRLPEEAAFVSLDSNDPDGQTLLFEYPRAMDTGAYLRPVVKMELGARSDVEPTATPEIRPYVGECAEAAVGPSAFRIRTVEPVRTFWEKAMLLHEERLRAGGAGPKDRLSRHYYDVYRLLRAGVGARAAADIALFERIAAHRAVYFPRNSAVRESLKRGTLSLLPQIRFEAAWRDDYDRMREVMFFGEPPTFDEILREVAEFERSFNSSSASNASSP